MSCRIDELQDCISRRIAERGRQLGGVVLPVGPNSRFPGGVSVRLHALQELARPVRVEDEGVDIMALGLEDGTFFGLPDLRTVHYKLKDSSGRVFWTVVGEPWRFKDSEEVLSQVLGNL